MKAFVIMPFKNSIAEDLYRLSTKPICEELQLEFSRADELFTTNPILDDVLSAINEASIIIADISGKNPNVFYELGISHFLKQSQTIMITQDEFKQVPFDIAHYRILKYENTVAGKASYEKDLRLTLQNILADYKSIYKREFDFIISALQQIDSDFEVFWILALAQHPKPIAIDDDISVTGHNKKIDMACTGGSSNASAAFSLFAISDLVKIENGRIQITEKGRAFVEIVKEKGYVLDKMHVYD